MAQRSGRSTSKSRPCVDAGARGADERLAEGGPARLDKGPHRIYFGSRIEPEGEPVAVNLSIKNVPDELAASLRARAARNHRSIQGELMVILEEALASERRLDARELLGRVRKLKLTTGDEATRIVRADRDGR